MCHARCTCVKVHLVYRRLRPLTGVDDDCSRGGLNPQGVLRAPHQVPNLERLPVSPRLRRMGARRGLVAAGIFCRWLPPRVRHSFAEPRVGVEPTISSLAGGAPYHLATGAPSTPGQECNTAPGRFHILGSGFYFTQGTCHGRGHHAALEASGQANARTASQDTRARRCVGRERQACPRQETSQTRLAETQRTTRQVVAPLKTNAPRRRLASQAGCRYAGDPERPRLRYDLSRFASSTYFRRTIQKRPLMETV